MLKQQYRTELGIVSEILNIVMSYGREGTIISSIARRANLSHNTAIDKCQKLVDSGLLESVNNKKNRTFVVTEKGIHFFQQMQEFIEIAESIKVRY